MVKIASFTACIFCHNKNKSNDDACIPPRCLCSLGLPLVPSSLTFLSVEIPFHFQGAYQMVPPSLMTLLSYCPSSICLSINEICELSEYFVCSFCAVFCCCCLFLFCFCLKPLLGCKFFGQKDLTYLIHLCITHSTDIYWAHYVPACNLMPAYHRSSINIKPNWNVVGDLTPKSSKAFQSGVTFRESLSSALKSLAGFYSWKNWTMISGFSFLLGTYITLLLGREFPFPFPQLQARRVA